MKTSTKLLIVFFSCIPISLLGYNYMLNTAYKANRFERNYYKQEVTAYQKQQSPAFRHVVIDGTLKYDNAFKGIRPRILIDGDTSAKIDPSRVNDVSVMSQYSRLLRIRVKNDTLYLSFYNKQPLTGEEVNPIYGNNLVTIHAGNIRSVKTTNAYISITGRPSAADSLSLISSAYTQYDVNGLRINKLFITGVRQSELNINNSNNIGKLYYSLADVSLMRLSGHPVKEYHAIKVSDSSRIEINDNAIELQKRLQ